MVVRVYRGHFAERLPEYFVCPVRDHLIGIHVGLGTRTGLPHHKGEMIGQFSRCDLCRCPHDGPAGSFFKHSKVHVRQCRGLFLPAEGMDNGRRHPFGPDRKILQAALCLCTPIAVGGYRDLAHRIALGPGFVSGHFLFCSCAAPSGNIRAAGLNTVDFRVWIFPDDSGQSTVSSATLLFVLPALRPGRV